MKIIFLFAIIFAVALAVSAQDICNCPRYYAPVCSVYGITYGNICRLNCARAALLHYGACVQG